MHLGTTAAAWQQLITIVNGQKVRLTQSKTEGCRKGRVEIIQGKLLISKTIKSKPSPVYEIAKETLMYRTGLWTLWERERVGRFGRMALKHVKCHV